MSPGPLFGSGEQRLYEEEERYDIKNTSKQAPAHEHEAEPAARCRAGRPGMSAETIHFRQQKFSLLAKNSNRSPGELKVAQTNAL